MSTLNPELSQRARAWMSDDPDQSTRDDLERRLTAAEAGDEAELTELKGAFDGTLQFGTAGLRGAMGPGPNRMNVAVVSRAAAGIGAYLREVVGEARRVAEQLGAMEASAVALTEVFERINASVRRLDETTQLNAAQADSAARACRSLEDRADVLQRSVRIFRTV